MKGLIYNLIKQKEPSAQTTLFATKLLLYILKYNFYNYVYCERGNKTH